MKNPSNSSIKKLQTLIEMTSLINSTLDTHEIRKRAIEAATNLLGAEAGSLLLLDKTTGDLFFEVAVGEKGKKLKKMRLRTGQGIAGWVAKNGKPVIVHDVTSDRRFFKDADRITNFITKNMACVPVKTRNKTTGVLEAINKKKGKFNTDDIGILSALANQVAIAIENARLYEAATTDGLTGLYHHKYLEVRLLEEMERAKRYKYPVSLLMIDIDHFKKINDEHGHLAGDMVLEGLAMIFKKSFRLGDIVARYGGEEFAIVLPHTPRENAVQVAERIRAQIEKITFDELRITISIGVAAFDDKTIYRDIKELIKAADNALYSAKKNGRNRVETL